MANIIICCMNDYSLSDYSIHFPLGPKNIKWSKSMVKSHHEDEMFFLFFCMKHNLLCAGTAAHLMQFSSFEETSRAQPCAFLLPNPSITLQASTTPRNTLPYIWPLRLHSPIHLQCHMGDPWQLRLNGGVRVQSGQWQDAVPLILPQGTDCCCCLYASWLRAGVPHRSTRPWWSNPVSYATSATGSFEESCYPFK